MYIHYFKRNIINKLLTSMNSIGSAKFGLEDILYLANPLLLSTNILKSQSILLSTLEVDTHQNLLTLTLKPLLKSDKKVKKVDKDEDRDIERSTLKLKVKKKARSKLSFEEDYEVVNDFLEIDIPGVASPLPLARPVKQEVLSVTLPAFTIKQKLPSTTVSKKRNISSSSQKKVITNIEVTKPKEIRLSKPVSLEELASLLTVSKIDIIKALFLKGINLTVNQILDLNTAQKVGKDFDIDIITVSEVHPVDNKRSVFTLGSDVNFHTRPPIITIMGHVDHGKVRIG